MENSDDGYRAGVETSKVEYDTVSIRLPWEITEELLRENIEGEGYEDTVMTLMSTQLGIDLEDLHWNGDVTSEDPFLQINDGWLKLIKQSSKSHIVDHFKLVTGTEMLKLAPGLVKTQSLIYLRRCLINIKMKV